MIGISIHRLTTRWWRISIVGGAMLLSLISAGLAIMLVTEARGSLVRQVSRTQADHARFAARLIADELHRRSDIIYANIFHGARGDVLLDERGTDVATIFERLQIQLDSRWPHDSAIGAFRFVPARGFTETMGAATVPVISRELRDSLRAYLARPTWDTIIDANIDIAIGDRVIGGWFAPLGPTPADGVVGVTFSRMAVDTAGVNYAIRNVPLLPPSLIGSSWKMGRPIPGQEDLGVELVNIASGKRMVSIPARSNGSPTLSGTYRIESGSHGYAVTVHVPSLAGDPQTLSGFRSVSTYLASTLLLVAAALAMLAIWLLGVEQRDVRDRQIFLSKVSHELRTPLSLISAYSESLQRGTYTTPDARVRATDGIHRSAQHLRVLVENVLTLSRAETPGWQLSLQRFDFSETVRTTVELLAPLATARGAIVRIALDVPAYVRGDLHALRQVVTNLLDNAVKYGPDGQIITVTLATSEHDVTLTVDDEGPGVPAEVRDGIGTLFLRGNRSEHTPEPGTGIGLAVADEIVRRHNGRIAASMAPDGGGRFTVVLPRATTE